MTKPKGKLRVVVTDMRRNARLCLDRAKTFIAQGDADAGRHACLELRLAIEYLVYQQLQGYLAEVSDDAMRKWTPKQLIDEMLTIDPRADQTSRISFGREETYGVPPPVMKSLGEDRRFSLKWANMSHNALGNFLHSPTLAQIENGGSPSAEKILKKAKEIAEVIQHTLASPIFNVNFGDFYEFDCRCGRRIKRRSESFKREDGIKCPTCEALWDVVSETDDGLGKKATFEERQAIFYCHACGAPNYIGINHFKEGQVFVCDCGAKSETVLMLRPVEDEQKPA